MVEASIQLVAQAQAELDNASRQASRVWTDDVSRTFRSRHVGPLLEAMSDYVTTAAELESQLQEAESLL
jgi:hypothetical protein